MDFGIHQFTERLEDFAVALHRRLAREAVGDYVHVIMTLSFLRTRMPDMKMALVLNDQRFRLQSIRQAPLNTLGALFTHGNTSLNGLTVTLR